MQYIPQKASIIVKNTLLMRYVNMKPTFVGDLSWLDGSLCLIIALTIDADGLMLSIYLNTLDFVLHLLREHRMLQILRFRFVLE